MRSVINYFKRLNDALPGLIATILLYGLVVLLVGVWFFDEKGKYIIGLLVGIGQAVFLSISMASSILGIMEASEISKMGQVAVALKAVLRYGVVVATTFLMCYFGVGYIGTWFVGVMGLKVCALVQPLIHRVLAKKKGSNLVD